MSAETVSAFWFSAQARPFWFASTADFDAAVAARFLETWQAAARGELDGWAMGPEGALALVVVLDQFPLHMFRGRPEAFSTEAKARTVSRHALAQGWDATFTPAQRLFLFLPFMHSEALADQDESVELFASVGFPEGVGWARHHRELIRRFGRFPHRNAILGRSSTPDEIAYLASPGAFTG